MATAYARFSVPTCPSDGRWDVEETIREYSEAFLSASAAEVIFIGKCYPDNTGGIRFPFLVRAWTKANAEEVRLVDIPPLEVRLQMLLENALHTTAGSFDVTTYRVAPAFAAGVSSSVSSPAAAFIQPAGLGAPKANKNNPDGEC